MILFQKSQLELKQEFAHHSFFYYLVSGALLTCHFLVENTLTSWNFHWRTAKVFWCCWSH